MLSLLEAVFPDRCLSCDRVVSHPQMRDLCGRCAVSVIAIDGDSCPSCALPGRDDSVCVGCLLDPMPLSRIVAAYEYGGAIAEATRRAKERGDLAAWRGVVEWCQDTVSDELRRAAAAGFTVVPVPSSITVARKRGFELPSVALGWWGIRGRHQLRKRGGRAKQSGLAAPTRLENARASFQLVTAPAAKVCLFDDVVTTGSTVRALAELLLDAGTEEVMAVTIARTPRR